MSDNENRKKARAVAKSTTAASFRLERGIRQLMGAPDWWSPDEIRAEARRLREAGGSPADLQTVLAMIEGLAWLVKPQAERDKETNPPPRQYGE